MGSDAALGEPVEQLAESLELLRHVLGALAVEVVPASDVEDAPPDAASVAGRLTARTREALRAFARHWISSASPSSEFVGPVDELQVWIRPLLTARQEV